MGLSFTKKSFFYQKIDLSKISYKYGQYFDLVHAHEPCFFIASFVSFSFALLLSLSFAFHILSGCRKKLGVGQSLEIGP